MRREPAVAGQFYPGDPVHLRAELARLIRATGPQVEALGVVAPHAGYMYSGAVAGEVYGRLVPPEVAVILGPNHTGLGQRAAVLPVGVFLTPLGEVPIESPLAEDLLSRVPFLREDALAHLYEHSLEVQVPFLQYLNPEVSLVPVCLSRLSLEEIFELGEGLAQAVEAYPRRVTLVASTDFSHYVPDEVARRKDRLALERILELDPEGLVEVVARERISMCGVIPTAVMLVAVRALGAQRAELVRYATSGEVSGDYAQVVGYAGILIW
ncbi:AmmeMemoRadiSam system protein B [Thermosulfurimonas marina]|uniref:MEMO1 family protein FVE67_04475 n=1 Tax=Thermosulfurimonas marina TaxID=2047767 RepID=A0A6H1WSA0_9BACT|nr:AmmeMemoRadiSam system protein B [Thermosulfurimonas marina]QJA06095.1 AmmeMemoRadiSam system protein B [Thermosulfurimonas marina]